MLCFRYLLKPEIMCRSDRQFDPFTESVIDGMVAASVTVKVCGAFFLMISKVTNYSLILA